MTLPRAARNGLLVSALVRRGGDVLMVREEMGEAYLWLWPEGTDRDPLVVPGPDPRQAAELPEPR